MGTGSFQGVEVAGAWGLTPHHQPVPKVLEKSRAIPLLTLRSSVAYKKGENLPKLFGPKCLIKGSVKLFLLVLGAP